MKEYWCCILALAWSISVLGSEQQSAPYLSGAIHSSSGSERIQPKRTQPASLPKADSGLAPNSLNSAISEARHRVATLSTHQSAMRQNAGVTYFASNPANQVTLRFLNDGRVRMGSGLAGERWACTISQTGSRGQPVRVSPRRVEIAHTAALTEWYENKNDGVEHGFTILSRDADSDPAQDGIQIVAHVGGDLRVVPTPESGGELQFIDRRSDLVILGYRKLEVSDATGTEISARMTASSDGDSIRFDLRTAANPSYPITIDPLVFRPEAEAMIPTPSGLGGEGHRFGNAVWIGDDRALVGDPRSHTASSGRAGKVFAFRKIDGEWILQQTITSGSEVHGEEFGASISVDGDAAVVGVGQALLPLVNSAYVLSLDDGLWQVTTHLTGDDGQARPSFGTRVHIKGDLILVGADEDHTDTGNYSGSAYVFEKVGSTWVKRQRLIPTDGRSGDRFGSAVAVLDDGLMIGADAKGNPDNSTKQGSVYWFTRKAGIWIERQRILGAGDFLSGERFGASIAAEGGRVVVGAKRVAWVLERTGSEWSKVSMLSPVPNIPGTNTPFAQVSLSGDRAALGFPPQFPASSGNGGVAIFSHNNDVWAQTQQLFVEEGNSKGFGHSLHLSGEQLIVGALFADSTSNPAAGKAYMFTMSPPEGSWEADGALELGDSGSGDGFGFSLDLDGDTLVVGAPGDDTPSGADMGSAYVLDRSAGDWQHRQRLEGVPIGDFAGFGTAVGLEGDTLIVGAPRDRPSDSPIVDGSVFVFERAGDEWSQSTKLMLETRDSEFGTRLDLNSEVAIVTSTGIEGAASIFRRSGGEWSLEQRLTSPTSPHRTTYAGAVAIDGDTAVVGARRSGLSDGKVFVYERSADQWSLSATLSASVSADGSGFSIAVAIDGDHLAVGSNPGGGRGAPGSVYVYERSAEGWGVPQRLEADSPTSAYGFGESLAIDGSTLAISAIGDNQIKADGLFETRTRYQTGSVYIYQRAEGPWAQSQRLFNTSAAAGEGLGGMPVALNMDTLVFGTPRARGWDPLGSLVLGQGAVRMFRLEPASPLESWRLSHFGHIHDSGLADNRFDANGNGLSNLLDFSFGTHPTLRTAPSDIHVSEAGDLLNRGRPGVITNDEGAYVYRFLRRMDHDQIGLSYTAQFSSTPDEWFDHESDLMTIANDGEIEVVEIAFPPMLPDNRPAQFARLQVSLQ